MSEQKRLTVSEVFYSLEGETSFVGLPMVFIRLSGCNLACNWCDTDFARTVGDNDERLTIAEIMERISNYPHRYTCITGGEPLMQERCTDLAASIIERGSTLLLETNGTLPTHNLPEQTRIILDVKCPSSGEQGKDFENNFSSISKKDEVKFIVANRHDYEYAKEFCFSRNLFEKTNILFGPAFGKIPEKTLAEWIIADALAVRFNAGLHRTIWGFEVKGK